MAAARQLQRNDEWPLSDLRLPPEWRPPKTSSTRTVTRPSVMGDGGALAAGGVGARYRSARTRTAISAELLP